MKRNSSLYSARWCSLAVTVLFTVPAISQTQLDAKPATRPSAPIPMDQLGTVATKQYSGDGLSVTATPDGARLRCAFQRLEGEVTSEGLWLHSTVGHAQGERFRVVAAEVGRVTPDAPIGGASVPASWLVGSLAPPTDNDAPGITRPTEMFPGLPCTGRVSVAENVARFRRDGLTEEYSVAVDGVRQDFIVAQRPEGEGELRVELDVTGAKVEPLVNGARLVLAGSGRKLAYNRLRVVDATGRELPARMEISSEADEMSRYNWVEASTVGRVTPCAPPIGVPDTKQETSNGAHGVTRPTMLAVVVEDANAIYPVRIDPTFSDANWISMGGIPGANNTVRAAAVDGSGNLYIGGDFTIVGDVFANRIAKWNGSSWEALGSGIGGSSPSVYALAVLGSHVYAGGYFTDAGGTAATNIAEWNGSGWSSLGAGMDNYVRALAVLGSEVFAGGNFTNADGIEANCIAKWDGNSWTALGSGLGGIPPGYSPPFVFALTVSGGDVYAGGQFLAAGGNPATNIAKWDGTNWTNLGSGTDNNVYALAVWGGDLYVGGYFSAAGGSPASKIAKWNGTNWAALGSGMAGGSGYPYVFAFAVSGSILYAVGDFTTADSGAANYVAKWDASSWTALGSGMDGNVLQMAVSGSNLYVGGTFTAVGGIAANRIAKWNGNSWTNLGSGMNSDVRALAVSGSNVYAGGYFTSAGGSVANRIARWNGNSWTNLGSGMSSWVLALAASGSNLYAGGAFGTAGGRAASYIAKWNGSTWTNLGSGMDQYVTALAGSETNVYAGGQFTRAGGSSNANYIAKWNGSTWTNLGSGLSSFVWSLAISGGDLYAAGPFTKAGGSTANRIAKWNGSNWAALGSGLNNSVFGLAVSGSDVYAGGTFTTAGGSPANYIAKWNGTNWAALGSGLNNSVFALAISGSNLHVGGSFTTAGNKVSAYVAKANLGVAPGRFGNLVYSPATGFSCTFSDGTVGQPYRIQVSPSLAVDPWTDLTNFIYTAPIVITDASAGATTNQFFRAVTP